MTNLTAAGNSTFPPPYPAAHHEISTPNAVACLVALITVPMVAYTLFVAVRCCRIPAAAADPASGRKTPERVELVCGVRFRKEGAAATSAEAAGINDQCPVCLSAFAEGEEIRLLGACRHAFHEACVDMWLYSHSSCPVCRAAVPVRRPRVRAPPAGGEEDLRQGLPDASDLI
ncbi:RING/U-box superfamily protein [Striga asiatica]|uniref:RING/U-box superfamily protein n=1 Tax=Striga asiatica TaxID=4170 RepID=A0A5A7RJF4_STRAF|nr:RING/U-box superfamily protein [Striga asiatica]